MPGVFISYRRSDSSGYAGRLFDILSSHFGRENTYMDLDTIEGGDDFAKVIEQKINVSDVLVAVIGSSWLAVAAKDGTRLADDPRDFVRLEIGEALARGIRVIPVLVGGALMPRAEDLPQDLRTLCDRQAVEIRDAHFHADAEQLAEVLHKALHGVGFRLAMAERGRVVPVILTGVGLAIVILLSLVLVRHPKSDSSTVTKAIVEKPDSPPVAKATVAKSDAPVTNADRVVKTSERGADISGQWKATVKYDWGDTYVEAFEFELADKEVSGTASFLGRDRAIVDGRIAGHRISFTTKSLSTLGAEDKTYEDKHYYKGIVDQDTIQFSMVTDSSTESHAPIHFLANKIKTK